MMRSRSSRLTLCALAWITLVGAAFYTFRLQLQVETRRALVQSFERSARDATDVLNDLQAGQQAYVAIGQDSREWMPKVTGYLRTLASRLEHLGSTTSTPDSGASVNDAKSAAGSVSDVDRRVRDQIVSGELRLAADEVFGEGADAVARAISNIDAAVAAERLAAEGFEGQRRRAQAAVLAAAAVLVAVVVGLIGMRQGSEGSGIVIMPPIESEPEYPGLTGDEPRHERAEAPLQDLDAGWASSSRVLSAMADICTEFGRARDADDVRSLLERSAEVMGARGIIVWLGDTSGSDLRPVFAHGYSESTLARISTVPRSADNAAAAAYRTGETQVVRARRGESQGAIVAPLLAVDGCIGALTAEIREHGDEEAEQTRSLALILASQLAGVLSPAAHAPAVHANDNAEAAAS